MESISHSAVAYNTVEKAYGNAKQLEELVSKTTVDMPSGLMITTKAINIEETIRRNLADAKQKMDDAKKMAEESVITFNGDKASQATILVVLKREAEFVKILADTTQVLDSIKQSTAELVRIFT
jgi:hypothetical protein